MKQVLLSLCVCLSLSACESIPTMSEIENFDWASLNPLTEKDTVQQVEIGSTPAIQKMTPEQRQAALQTELNEIQNLTGEKPVVTPNPQGRVPVSAIIGGPNTAPSAAQASLDPAAPTPQVTTNVPSSKGAIVPVKKPVVNIPQGNVVATASISEGAPAPAVPQGTVQSAPTADSIRWNQAASSPRTPTAQPQQATSPAPVITQQPGIKGCPRLTIMPEAQSMTNFNGDPANGQMTSRGSIVDVKGGCTPVDGGVQIDLTMIMKGAITNAGRFNGDSNLEAFITFPYFLTVTDPAGNPVDKDIKATAFRFKPKLNALDHAEQISRYIPMNDITMADRYVVTVGFQLSRKQLEYNRAQTMVRTNNTRISPDVPAAQQKSVNPLNQ